VRLVGWLDEPVHACRCTGKVKKNDSEYVGQLLDLLRIATMMLQTAFRCSVDMGRSLWVRGRGVRYPRPHTKCRCGAEYMFVCVSVRVRMCVRA
jgi:hypothetical protein